MSADFCSKCDAYMYCPDAHNCPPSWEILIDEYHDDEGIIVFAYDAEEAAEKAIKEWDAEGDYICSGGSEILVTVKGFDGSTKRFAVTAEHNPSYYASEIA